MSGWQDVLDIQLDILHYWLSENGQKYGDLFGESMRRVDAEVFGLEARPGSAAHQATQGIAMVEAKKMVQADPFYVDEDMMTLVEAAAETFQPEPLQETDLLTSHGYVQLPRPIFIKDRSERLCTVRSFAWMPIFFHAPGNKENITASGIHLSLYSHIDDEWEYEETFREQFTRADMDLIKAKQGTPYQLFHLTPWQFGEKVPTGEWAESAIGHWRPIQAFFRLTLQTIGDRYNRKPPRAARRRWERAFPARPKEDQYITVVRLRRPRAHRDGDADPKEVNWTHRWIVGGFWRNQWYPSLGVHRQIYIEPYTKGPEDLPLLVRKGRAYELVR